MLRRALIRQSRLFAQRPRTSSLSFSRTYTTPSPRKSSTLTQTHSLLSTRTRTYATKSEEDRGREADPVSEPSSHVENDSQTGGAGVKAESGEQKAAGKDGAEEDPTATALAAKEREIVDLKDRYLRSVADFRNLQERTKRDVQAARDFAIQRFARDLVDSVDNLDRALSTVNLEGEDAAANKDLQNLVDGLRMTETVLMSTLEKHGLKRFDPAAEGGKFDPNMHEATFQAPQQGKEDGTVFFTQQKGFLLNGRVLRAAKVGVVKNS